MHATLLAAARGPPDGQGLTQQGELALAFEETTRDLEESAY